MNKTRSTKTIAPRSATTSTPRSTKAITPTPHNRIIK